MKINLTQGELAEIDDADFERVSKCKWHYTNTGYAATRKNGKIILMHRFLLGAKKGIEVDHKNGKKLDNRSSNLRFCTRSQNMMNVGLRKNNISGYRGVSYEKNLGRWRMRLGLYGKTVISKTFKTKEEAALAYVSAAVELHGEFFNGNPV